MTDTVRATTPRRATRAEPELRRSDLRRHRPRAPMSGSACPTTPPTTARSPTSPPTSTTPTRAYNPIAPEVWKELREAAAPSPTPTATAACGCRSRTTPCTRSPTTPSTSRAVRVVVSVGRPGDLALPAPDRWRAADHQRPAVPRHGPPPAAAGVRAEADRAVGARGPHAVPANCSTGIGDDHAGRDVIDAAVQYAQHIPVNVIGRMLGFPAGGRGPVPQVRPRRARAHRRRAGHPRGHGRLGNYITAQIHDHRENPRDDLTTYLMNVEIDGHAGRPTRSSAA